MAQQNFVNYEESEQNILSFASVSILASFSSNSKRQKLSMIWFNLVVQSKAAILFTSKTKIFVEFIDIEKHRFLDVWTCRNPSGLIHSNSIDRDLSQSIKKPKIVRRIKLKLAEGMLQILRCEPSAEWTLQWTSPRI